MNIKKDDYIYCYCGKGKLGNGFLQARSVYEDHSIYRVVNVNERGLKIQPMSGTEPTYINFTAFPHYFSELLIIVESWKIN